MMLSHFRCRPGEHIWESSRLYSEEYLSARVCTRCGIKQEVFDSLKPVHIAPEDIPRVIAAKEECKWVPRSEVIAKRIAGEYKEPTQ